MKILQVVCGSLALCLIIAVLALIYISATSEKIILQKNDWRCSQTRTVDVPGFITDGNGIVIPTNSRNIECVNYVRAE